MSSVFVPENSGSPQQPKQPEQARPKRPRSSLACIRCRKKKVKCDFVQPTCGRCAIAGLPCSYATPPRRVDGHAFDQLGNHVEELKERMQKMQSELAMMKNNLHPFASSSSTTATSDQVGNDELEGSGPMMMSSSDVSNNNNMALATSGSSSSEQSVTWKLSLSPSGLRIDTNIASVADLYRILLNGISQLNINNDSTSLFNPESSGVSGNSPLFNNPATPRRHHQQQQQPLQKRGNYLGTDGGDKGGRLWEVDDNEARKILQEKKSIQDSTLPKEVLDKLMHSCYHTCFLAYQTVDKELFMKQYMSNEGLDPLLSNSINAWVSKHGCIYHQAAGGVADATATTTTPTDIATTMGEVYFKNARQLLKKCFDISSSTTIHALLNLYMYQLSSERSSLAYLYIGLAIRMAQDLKFHKKEHMSADLNQRETNKRLWWSAYWLDLCAALESNRPTMVDDKDCDLDYPTRLDYEDDETGYRIHFSVYSIKLMRIRKDITKHLPSEQSGQSLLSAISRLENALTNWLNELPQELHFIDLFQKSGSFKDEACLILNIQYQTTWIMLHKFFLPKQDQTATPVALLSLNICTKSANLITRMLSIYASNLNWCQFFYAMDGIIASVTIHQVNALSNEKEVSFLAQRNLIITAAVLKDSPLMYMVKVCEIIESIEGFLKKNRLAFDLSDLPVVNEDSISQQSISSVFHPAVFESHMMPSQQAQQAQQAHQQHSHQQHSHQHTQHSHQHQQHSQHHHPFTTGSDALSPSIQSNSIPMNSPQSQHSSSTIRVPSQLSSAMFQQQQASNTATTAGQQQQQQQQHLNKSSIYNMVESSMLFNDPTNLMGFNMASSGGPQGGQGGGGGDMDQLLLRNMGFDINSSSNNNNTTSNDGRMYMFDNRSTTGSTTPSSHHNNSNYNNSAYGFNTQQQHSSTFTENTPSDSYPNFLNNAELFGTTTTTPTTATTTSPSGGYSTNAFDPSSLFQMDPATMSALLYNNNGMPNYPYQQNDENDLLYGSRKRIHRDWEDSS